MGNTPSSPVYNYSAGPRSATFKHTPGQAPSNQVGAGGAASSSSGPGVPGPGSSSTNTGTGPFAVASSSSGKAHANSHEYLTRYEWTPERIRTVVSHWAAFLIRDLERDKHRHFHYLAELNKQCEMAHVTALTAPDEQLEQSFSNLQMLQACLGSGHEVSDKLQRRLQWVKNTRDILGLVLGNEHAFYDGSLKDLLVALGLIDSSGTYVICVKERGDKDTPKPIEPPPGNSSQQEAELPAAALTCEICMDKPRGCLLLPCKHWKFCNDCIQDYCSRLADDEERCCPSCRQPIEDIVYDVYM